MNISIRSLLKKKSCIFLIKRVTLILVFIILIGVNERNTAFAYDSYNQANDTIAPEQDFVKHNYYHQQYFNDALEYTTTNIDYGRKSENLAIITDFISTIDNLVINFTQVKGSPHYLNHHS
ncbi:MAG TPA: hypothetical protein QKA14_02055, partial [Candidatus Megaira endosymbiont of Hartmannula sinica]|nr:hypothetical protein [Candidatus Megaera endosymbiont of Hartmannula sinica]